MFNQKLLESSEFYNKRYQNFTTLIIFPTLMLLTILILIACFTHKEIVVKSTGEIAPRKILKTIQSTSNNPIIKNELLTKKDVRAGELLVEYQNTETDTNLKLQSSSLQDLQDHAQALTRYQDSINQNKNLFLSDDYYGCSSAYQNYLAQCRSITSDFQQQVENQNNTTQQKDIVSDALAKKHIALNQYQALLNAIINNTTLSSKNDYYTIFSNYQNQIQGLSAVQVDKVKKEIVSNIKQQIEQVNDTITNYRTQYAGITSAHQKSDTLKDKITELKSQQLASITKELKAINQEIKQLKIQYNATQINNKNAIIASESGTVKLLVDKTKLESIPQGTNIAQIYPNIKQHPDLIVDFYISTHDISTISEGQTIRYHLTQRNSKPLIITGKIANITAHPVATKQGNFYQVSANLDLNAKDYQTIYYGQVGTISVITGKHTWLSYIKNILLHA